MAGRKANLKGLWTHSNRIYAVLLLINTADGAVSTLISAYLQSLGYHVADIGFMVAVIGLAALVSRVPAGRVADSAHPRAWFRGAAATFAITLALYPFATDPLAFWAVRIVHGLSLGVASTLNFAAFLGQAGGSGAHRARSTSLYMTAMAGGYALGNFMSGVVADQFGFAAAFQVGAVSVIGALLVSPPAAPRPVASPDAALAPGLWRTLLVNREMRAVPLIHFSANFLNNVVATLFPLYVLAIGQTLAIVGTARGLQSLTNVFVRPFGGRLVGLMSPLMLGTGGVALNAVAIAAIPFTTSALVYYLLFILAGTGRAGAVLAGALRTTELTDRGVVRRGTASALMTAGGDLGGIMAPIVAGATASVLGVPASLHVIPVGLTLLLLLAVVPWGRGKKVTAVGAAAGAEPSSATSDQAETASGASAASPPRR